VVIGLGIAAAAIVLLLIAESTGVTHFLTDAVRNALVPAGTVELVIDEPGAVFLIDGNQVGKAGDAKTRKILDLHVGKHTVEVRKDGKPTSLQEFTVRRDDWQTVHVPPLYAGDPLFEGRWTVVREEGSGVIIPADMWSLWWDFKGAQVFKKFHPKDDPSVCEYLVDKTKTPPEIDLVSGSQTLARGIFTVNRDELTVCFATPPEPRPKSTTVTRMNTSLYITVLRRETTTPMDDLVSLFNRKDLTGWKTNPKSPGHWECKDGVLVGSNGPGQLVSERNDYTNFYLRMEALVSKGADASGCFRTQTDGAATPGRPRNPTGYTVDLAEGPDVCTGPISFENPQNRVWTTYGANSKVRPGEWFTLEVTADGNLLSTKVNGQPAVDFLEEINAFKKGHIALKVWRPDTIIKFRKIEIKELPPE
jgi:uncharacterized protein (TIGR03067 family)